MKKILVTGSNGFVGKNLLCALSRVERVQVRGFDLGDDPSLLPELVAEADLIYHLAGVNRPQTEDEFRTGNADLTRSIVDRLSELGRRTLVVLSSSTQAALENAYGVSKRAAEEAVFAYGKACGAPVYVFRLTNVFGKWSRPNYNSVVSTFCHNISHNLPITISDPDQQVELVYIDDVVTAFLGALQGTVSASGTPLAVTPTRSITLGELAEQIHVFREIRSSLVIPDLSDDFGRKLHATYLSYLEPDDFCYPLDIKTDNRGALAEFIKSPHCGQMFVSRTFAGVVRGDHHHDTKIEKFCVLHGEAVIRFRHILSDQVIEHHVNSGKWEVVDIPPGYTHHIENVSAGEMIVLFWANQIFDPGQPDTFYLPVHLEKSPQ